MPANTPIDRPMISPLPTPAELREFYQAQAAALWPQPADPLDALSADPIDPDQVLDRIAAAAAWEPCGQFAAAMSFSADDTGTRRGPVVVFTCGHVEHRITDDQHEGRLELAR